METKHTIAEINPQVPNLRKGTSYGTILLSMLLKYLVNMK